LRGFVEAVLAYTGASKVNIIGHSMGVTLGRKVVQGGRVASGPNPFDLGPSLASKVETFIGIAGANWGLTTCYLLPTI
jgi:triacylglycerol lipase